MIRLPLRRVYFYDLNALSNFVTDAPRIVGFDPSSSYVAAIHKTMHEFHRSMRYRCVSVRIKSDFPATAGDARIRPSREFSATVVIARPGLITVVRPFSLQK